MAKNMWQVKCDTAQINQVIRNLIINAREASRGTIDFSCINVHHPGTKRLTAGDYLRISILDNGTGISDKNLSRIFDPYFSTKDVSANKKKGLGLAIVYSIINKHRGSVSKSSHR